MQYLATSLLEGNIDTTIKLPHIEELEEVGAMRPPAYKKKVGRTQTERFRSAENQHQPGSHGVPPPARQCRNCRLTGHNAASCQQPAQRPPVDFPGTIAKVAAPFM